MIFLTYSTLKSARTFLLSDLLCNAQKLTVALVLHCFNKLAALTLCFDVSVVYLTVMINKY